MTFTCLPCAFETPLKNNYTRHLACKKHGARCGPAAVPVAPVAPAVPAAAPVVPAAAPAEDLNEIEKLKNEIRDLKFAHAMEIKDLKHAHEMKEKDSDNEFEVTELKHALEMSELKLNYERKQPKKEAKEEVKPKEDKEAKRIAAILETEARKLDTKHGRELLEYLTSEKREKATLEHAVLRLEKLKQAIQEIEQVELTDLEEIMGFEDRAVMINHLTIVNPDSLRYMCLGHPEWKELISQNHSQRIDAAILEIGTDNPNLKPGGLRFMDFLKIKEKKTVKYVPKSTSGAELEANPPPYEPFELEPTFNYKQPYQPWKQNGKTYYFEIPSLDVYETTGETENLVGKYNPDDDVIEFNSSISDDEDEEEKANPLPWEHKETEYFRDEMTHKVYDFYTKKLIGLFNEGADEIDFYESDEPEATPSECSGEEFES